MPSTALSPRKSPRQERSRRTVARILDAATHVFHERGYSAATTNDIAVEAGVSVGSLYQYFPNKDALLVALMEQHIESATAGLAELLGQLRYRCFFLFSVHRNLSLVAICPWLKS